MEEGFSSISGPGGVSAIAFSGLLPDFKHGFAGKGVLDSPHSPEAAREILAALFPAATVIVPRQTHGNRVVDGADPRAALDCEGDALTMTTDPRTARVLCIRTADCLPIIIVSASRVALVHAGWRGLANGVIQNTLDLFSPNESIRAFIGPCAGPLCYPVGEEVFEAIGEPAVRSPEGSGLKLAATARNILRAGAPEIQVHDSGVCTICDQSFHSHRRDGVKSGRNFTYLVIGPDSD